MDIHTSNSAAKGLSQFPVSNKKEASPDESNLGTQTINAHSTSIAQLSELQKENMEELRKAIEAIQGPQKTIEISVHQETHAIMIKVMNKETGDLIREVPPEKILDLTAYMMKLTGIVIDRKV